MSELPWELYPPPLLTAPGYLHVPPYGGYRTFALTPWHDQRYREHSINVANQHFDQTDDKTVDNRAIIIRNNSGLEHRDISVYEPTIVETETYNHIEEIIMDRLRVLCDGTASRMQLIGEEHQTLINECIADSLQPTISNGTITPGTSYQPIVNRYVTEAEFFPFIVKYLSFLRERRANVQAAKRNGDVEVKIHKAATVLYDIEEALAKGGESYLLENETSTPPESPVVDDIADSDEDDKEPTPNKMKKFREMLLRKSAIAKEEGAINHGVRERHQLSTTLLPQALTGLHDSNIQHATLIAQLRIQINEQLINGTLSEHAFGNEAIPLSAIQPIIDWINENRGQENIPRIILRELALILDDQESNESAMRIMVDEINRETDEEILKRRRRDAKLMRKKAQLTRRRQRILSALQTHLQNSNIIENQNVARSLKTASARSVSRSLSKSVSRSVSNVPSLRDNKRKRDEKKSANNNQTGFKSNLPTIYDGALNSGLKNIGSYKNPRHVAPADRYLKQKFKRAKLPTTTSATSSSSGSSRSNICQRCGKRIKQQSESFSRYMCRYHYNAGMYVYTQGICRGIDHDNPPLPNIGGSKTRKNRRRKNRTKRKKKKKKKNTKKHRRRKNRTRYKL